MEAAQRDPARFGDLYELHFEWVYAFVVQRVADRGDAEDITAEVFHKALAGLVNYEWRGAPFANWLFRIALNAIADRAKRVLREIPGLDAPEPSVLPDMAAVEERARLFRLVNDLPSDQRRVVYQRFVEQRTIREIALELGRSEGAVKQLQLRALQNLRSRMEGAHA